MSILIWTGAAWAKGGYGGWAHVRIIGEEAHGVAGGDRRTTPARMALTAAVEALETHPPGAGPVRLHAPHAALLTGEADDDQDLRARLARAMAARPGGVAVIDSVEAAPEPAFVQGWAAFALDIARTKGAFSSPIPKPNLKTLLAKR